MPSGVESCREPRHEHAEVVRRARHDLAEALVGEAARSAPASASPTA